MPVLIVYGVADNKRNAELEKFWSELRATVKDVPELGLTKDQVSVFFPRDAIQEGLGEEIIIFVDGLFEKPERTANVRKRYANKLRDIAKKYYPDALAEVFVRPFNPESGFSTSME
jgi:hypothetical protein